MPPIRDRHRKIENRLKTSQRRALLFGARLFGMGFFIAHPFSGLENRAEKPICHNPA
jgi:hypothetical protein